MEQISFELFGPGDTIRPKTKTAVMGHCGHQYAFLSGFKVILETNQTFLIMMTKMKNGQRQYAVNAVDSEKVTRLVWLDEQDIVPVLAI